MHSLEHGTYYELGPRTYWFLLLEWSSVTVVLLLLAFCFQIATGMLSQAQFILEDFLDLFTKIALGLAVLTEAVAVLGTHLQYGVSRVMLDDTSMRIVRGILSKREVALPYRRIQGVEIHQSLPQRIFGLAQVNIISTADQDQNSNSSQNSDNEIIPMMDYPLAQTLASTLTSQAQVERMRMVK